MRNSLAVLFSCAVSSAIALNSLGSSGRPAVKPSIKSDFVGVVTPTDARAQARAVVDAAAKVEAEAAAALAAEAAKNAWKASLSAAASDADGVTRLAAAQRAAKQAWVDSLRDVDSEVRLAFAEAEAKTLSEGAAKKVAEKATARLAAAPGDASSDGGVSDAKALLQRVKDAGVAGAVSYALWELAFWAASVPVCLVAYFGVTGHFPDLSDQDDLAKLGAEAFAFVNVARFAVPLRIGLALGSVPWVQANIIDRVQAWRGAQS